MWFDSPISGGFRTSGSPAPVLARRPLSVPFGLPFSVVAVLPGVLLLSLLVGGCRDSARNEVDPNVPRLREPESHAPEPVPVPPPERVARQLVAPAPPPITARPIEAPIPLPDDPEDPEPDPTPAGVDNPSALEIPDEPEAIPPPPETPDDPEEEAMQWLGRSGEITPGCLRGGNTPNLALPSPKALAWMLRMQPRELTGVVREALVCLFQLPRISGAEVYGNSAFTPTVADASVLLAGGERPLGVVVMVIKTDEPRGAGVAVAALDERAAGWFVRGATWIGWPGQPGRLEIASVKPQKLLTHRRDGLELVIEDRDLTQEHHLALTTTERLIHVIGVTRKGRLDDGTRRVGRLHSRGRGYPRTLVYRALDTPPPIGDGPSLRRWVRETWSASKDTPYRATGRDTGLVDLAGVRTLLDAGHTRDALWLYDELPRTVRESAMGYIARADIATARKRKRTALRYWKQAIKADDAPPTVHRDYGRYLAGRKIRRKAKASLKRYLELAPEAEDRAAVEAEIDAL